MVGVGHCSRKPLQSNTVTKNKIGEGIYWSLKDQPIMIWEYHFVLLVLDRLPSQHRAADTVIIVKAARYTKVVHHMCNACHATSAN